MASTGLLTKSDLIALLLMARGEAVPLSRPDFRDVLTRLFAVGLIEEESPPSEGPNLYVISARGTAYVRMLLALPLPTKQEAWVHPLTGKPV